MSTSWNGRNSEAISRLSAMFRRDTFTTAAAGAFAPSSPAPLCAPPHPATNPARRNKDKSARAFVSLIALPPKSRVIRSSLVCLPFLSKGLDRSAKRFDPEIRGLAQPDNFFLLRVHFMRHGGNLIRYFKRDGLNSVAIAVNQVSWLHFHAPHYNSFSEIDNVSEGMRDGRIMREHLKIYRPGRGK